MSEVGKERTSVGGGQSAYGKDEELRTGGQNAVWSDSESDQGVKTEDLTKNLNTTLVTRVATLTYRSSRTLATLPQNK